MKRFLVGVVMLASACGGGASAVSKCDDLVDRVCDRTVECFPGQGTHGDCVTEVQAQLPCGAAKRVSSSYGRCMDQLDDASCAGLFPNGQLQLPADCNGVILTSRMEPDVEVGPATSALDERD